MITVGIQESIRITEASINDKGTLIVKLQQDGGGNGSLLDMLSSSSSSASDSDVDAYFWPIKEDDRVTSDTELFKSALNSLKTFRAALNHILEQYITSDKIHWDPLNNLGLASEADLSNGLMDSSKRPILLIGLYDNYVKQFVAQISSFVGPTSPLFRVKFLRASKDKSFPTLPKFAPFIEPMSIQKAASKLQYSKYELGYRKNDPEGKPSGVNLADPTPSEGAGTKAGKGNPEEAAVVANLFGMK